MRTLIVEDDNALGNLLAKGLRERGITPSLVRSAEAAHAELGLEKYDSVVLDLRLPMASGLYVVEKIREMPAVKRPQVVVMTAGEIPHALDRTMVCAVILKPLNVSAVAAFVAGLQSDSSE